MCFSADHLPLSLENLFSGEKLHSPQSSFLDFSSQTSVTAQVPQVSIDYNQPQAGFWQLSYYAYFFYSVILWIILSEQRKFVHTFSLPLSP